MSHNDLIPKDVFDCIVEQVKGWWDYATEQQLAEFLGTPLENLPLYHNTLGREIRNHSRLWEYKWEPNIVNGFDISDNHPDAVSMNIIKQVWRELTDESINKSTDHNKTHV